MKVKVFNIEWDVDEIESLDDLPKEIEIDFPQYDSLDEEIFDEISDYLSDEYGFCHNGFRVETEKI